MITNALPSLVIAATGADRPGLVDDLTGYLLEAGVNIADSRMANLAGRFSLLLLIQGSEEQIDNLRDQLPDQAKAWGLTVLIGEKLEAHAPTSGLPYRVEVTGMDQAGIVHRISHLLSQKGVNIEEVETTLQQSAYGRPPVFNMVMRITLPTQVRASELRRDLIELCDQLNMDGRIEPE